MATANYGVADTYASNADYGDLVVSIEDLVKEYPPQRFPLVQRLNGDIFEKEVDNPYHQWKVENLRPETDLLATAITDGTPGTTTTVVATTPGVFNIDDVIIVEGSGISEQMIVTAVAGDGITLTVIRKWAGTTASNYTVGQTIRRIGIASSEGADMHQAVNQGLDTLFNYSQIFEDTVDLSGTELTAHLYKTGKGSNMGVKVQKKQQELLQMLQASIVRGVANNDTGTKRRTMGGLKWFIDNFASSNIIHASGVNDWTTQSTYLPSSATTIYTKMQQYIDDLALTIEGHMGTCTELWVGPSARRRMNLWQIDRIRIPEGKEGTKGERMAEVIETTVGKLEVVTVPGHAMDDLIMLVDGTRIGYKPFVGRGWGIYEKGRSGDSQTKQILGEYTMQVATPKVFGYIDTLGL